MSTDQQEDDWCSHAWWVGRYVSYKLLAVPPNRGVTVPYGTTERYRLRQSFVTELTGRDVRFVVVVACVLFTGCCNVPGVLVIAVTQAPAVQGRPTEAFVNNTTTFSVDTASDDASRARRDRYAPAAAWCTQNCPHESVNSPNRLFRRLKGNLRGSIRNLESLNLDSLQV